jgi:hypothetical protein
MLTSSVVTPSLISTLTSAAHQSEGHEGWGGAIEGPLCVGRKPSKTQESRRHAAATHETGKALGLHRAGEDGAIPSIRQMRTFGGHDGKSGAR